MSVSHSFIHSFIHSFYASLLFDPFLASGAMVDETQDQQQVGGAVVAPGGGSAEPPKKIPRGVVLGPDGKP